MDPNVLAIIGALATSFALSLVKKTDTALVATSLFRKLQPTIMLAGSFFAPFLAGHGFSDPSVLASAPLATVAAITIAELLSLFKAKKKV